MTNKVVITKEGNTVVELTGAELDEHNAILAEQATLAQEEATAKTQKATDQANGNQKLLDLGLTQAEATALTGYTPPTEESE